MRRSLPDRGLANPSAPERAMRREGATPTARLPSVIGLTGGNLGTDGRLVSLRWLRCRLHNAGGG